MFQFPPLHFKSSSSLTVFILPHEVKALTVLKSSFNGSDGRGARFLSQDGYRRFRFEVHAEDLSGCKDTALKSYKVYVLASHWPRKLSSKIVVLASVKSVWNVLWEWKRRNENWEEKQISESFIANDCGNYMIMILYHDDNDLALFTCNDVA